MRIFSRAQISSLTRERTMAKMPERVSSQMDMVVWDKLSQCNQKILNLRLKWHWRSYIMEHSKLSPTLRMRWSMTLKQLIRKAWASSSKLDLVATSMWSCLNNKVTRQLDSSPLILESNSLLWITQTIRDSVMIWYLQRRLVSLMLSSRDHAPLELSMDAHSQLLSINKSHLKHAKLCMEKECQSSKSHRNKAMTSTRCRLAANNSKEKETCSSSSTLSSLLCFHRQPNPDSWMLSLPMRQIRRSSNEYTERT